jgi:translation initiation factor IF-1
VSKGDLIDVDGVVVDALGGGQYSVQTANAVIRARLGGKLQKFHIRVLPGDKVQVAVSPYDMTHGIITYRHSQPMRAG